jgi:hypothetical protein
MYTCHSCKSEVSEIHICGKTPKGSPVVVQYVQSYPSVNREYVKTFGSRSQKKKDAILLRRRNRGELV